MAGVPLPFVAEIEPMQVGVAAGFARAKGDGVIANQKLRFASGSISRLEPVEFGEENSQEMGGTHRRGIESDRPDFMKCAVISEHNTMHRPIAANRDAIDQIVTRIAQNFEDRHERGIEVTRGQLPRQCGGMIEDDFAVVIMDQRARVEILHTADP
jgi:hypothetical protein